jgi:HK97 family phage portal protein
MAIVQSSGSLQTVGTSTIPPLNGSGTDLLIRDHGLLSMSPYTYAMLYRTQPNVRTVVDFLARNLAQIGLHAYRRVSDIDRVRLYDHQIIQWLDKPTTATCRYRLIESLIQDLGIYFRAYWLKLRQGGQIGLLRLPPHTVTVRGWLLPSSFVWTLPDGQRVELAVDDVVYFGGYDPLDPLAGLSPLETLRQLLAEDIAANTFRQAYWSNSARLEGVITRPQTAPKWTPAQKQSWREQWAGRFAGQPGQIPVLEDGMAFTPTSYSARESEFSAIRKLTREEVAAAYHVPQPMVGILDHATYSNIKEQHKQLYQDTLGPWTVWLQEEIERQLLVECTDQDGIYLEFNIAEKLKGSFEEQAGALYTLIGRPIMTANEGRGRLNLPSIKNDPTADELALPLNTSGGPSALGIEAEPAPPSTAQLPLPTTPNPTEDSSADRVQLVLQATADRLQRRLAKVPPDERAAMFFVDFDRWQAELIADLTPLVGADRAATMALDANVSMAVALEKDPAHA